MAVGALPALAAPDWCQNISDGLYCAEPEATPPNFCGDKEISVALADGFADNPWRQMTTAAAINEASRCPNVIGWEHTDGQGNTQKAISDLQGLAAKGVEAIVVFPDAGQAMLPAIRDAYKQGSAVVPYRVKVGGTEGQDYNVFVGTNFYDHGVIWAKWIAEAMGGKGTLGYEGGPPGNSESEEKAQGMRDVLKDFPDIEWIGQEPFEATNWDPSLIAKSLTALIAKYPQIDGMFGDLSIPLLTSGAFQRADRKMPLIAGEDANGFGCYWEKAQADGSDKNFQFMTTSAEQWNVRLAIQWAIAEAAGGKVDQPLVVKDTKGGEHVVANPGDKIVTNFVMDDSLKGIVFCTPELPDSAGNGTSLTTAQTLGALKGGL
ncbi:MAG: substrate-binding domain-containing protein [Bauldia sp.]|nr:substrate-binding domain-containing protein [Bauldia sp.]